MHERFKWKSLSTKLCVCVDVYLKWDSNQWIHLYVPVIKAISRKHVTFFFQSKMPVMHVQYCLESLLRFCGSFIDRRRAVCVRSVLVRSASLHSSILSAVSLVRGLFSQYCLYKSDYLWQIQAGTWEQVVSRCVCRVYSVELQANYLCNRDTISSLNREHLSRGYELCFHLQLVSYITPLSQQSFEWHLPRIWRNMNW